MSSKSALDGSLYDAHPKKSRRIDVVQILYFNVSWGYGSTLWETLRYMYFLDDR